MKCIYKFSNLLGTVYSTGDLIFSNDGTTVISPVGNRITIYDLKNDKSTTLPLESKYNYNAMDLSPNGFILIAVNEEGDAHFISMISKMIIHKHRFKRRVRSVKFSPDGNHFAVCKEDNVFIFKFSGYKFENYKPFIMERVLTGATDDTTCIQWSFDSNLLAVGSKDMTTRLYSINKEINIKSYTFASHSEVIVGCFFEKESYDLSTISRNGHLCVWECSIEPKDLEENQAPVKRSKQTKASGEGSDVDTEDIIESPLNEEAALQASATNKNVTQDVSQGEMHKLKYKRLGRHYLSDIVKNEAKNVILTAAAYHPQNHILVVGFNNGSFFLYELPAANLLHSLSIANEHISTIAINSTGDWIAVGCSEAGQLLVWEWQSESYCLKQQGHSNNMTCLYYSPNGQYIVTGGHDGKVKLWNTVNGFCITTFHDHTSSISGVTFSHNQKFIVSSSLDGSIRAYDLIRYRNFKTFTSPKPVQFSCLALDSSDEFLAAGGQNIFEIYLWSVKTGTLLDILSGHEGPVVSLAFSPNPTSTSLASASWDKTLRLWNAIDSGSKYESIQLTADALCVVFRPDGKEIAVATLDGQIAFFNTDTSTQTGNIEGRKDLGSGRSTNDLITAKKSLEGKAFSSLCYSVDGTCIIAGGQSKNVCLYNVQESILLKKFEITQNLSLNSVSDVINRRKMTEFGYAALIEEREDNEGGNVKLRLPGVVKGDMSERSVKPEIRLFSIQFSPLGQSWAAVTTEGLLIYSLNPALIFDPFELDLGVTPVAVDEALQSNDYSRVSSSTDDTELMDATVTEVIEEMEVEKEPHQFESKTDDDDSDTEKTKVPSLTSQSELNDLVRDLALIVALKLSEISHIRKVVEKIPLCDISLILYNLPDTYVNKLLTFIADELEITKHVQFYIKWVNVILTQRGALFDTLTITPILIMLQKSMQEKYDSLSKLCDFNQYTMKYFNKMGQLKKIHDTSTNEIELDA